MAMRFFRLSVIIIFILLCLKGLSTPILAVQDSLANATDMLDVVLFGWRAEHHISFSLPSDSYPIRDIDYIQIYMPAFTDITLPTLITGDFAGFPIYSISGQYVRITNITVLPGGRINIDGLTAINPDSDDKFQIVIMVTEDELATRPKNVRSLLATLNHADVSVSATLPIILANLRITGSTAPDTFIVFTEAGAVLGTDVANALGGFNHLFSGLQPTTHQITLYGIDLNNLITSPIPLQIYTAASQETLISNVLLSPTLELNANDYLLGDPIIVSGSAIPAGSITVFVDTPLRTYYTTSADDGSWNYTITNSNEYVYGDYRAYALVQAENGWQSLVSNSQNFSIISGSGTTGAACGDISHGDLNCDGEINLIDFSILMYYWGTSNLAADINTDNLVNLGDFSIMMYWWGT